MRKAIDLMIHDVHAPGKDIYNNAFYSYAEMKEYIEQTFNELEDIPDDFINALETVKSIDIYPVVLSEFTNATNNVNLLFIDEYVTDDEVNDFIHGYYRRYY